MIFHGIRSFLDIYYELKIIDDFFFFYFKFYNRYVTFNYFPDKAIDLLDETCGRIRGEMWYEPEVITRTRDKLSELEVKEVSISKEQEKQVELLIIRQKISECREKLKKLVEQDEKENKIIQELNKAKREMLQAEKALINYQQKEIDLTKAAEFKYSIIPILKSKVDRL